MFPDPAGPHAATSTIAKTPVLGKSIIRILSVTIPPDSRRRMLYVRRCWSDT
jgi:hypothetical protein